MVGSPHTHQSRSGGSRSHATRVYAIERPSQPPRPAACALPELFVYGQQGRQQPTGGAYGHSHTTGWVRDSDLNPRPLSCRNHDPSGRCKLRTAKSYLNLILTACLTSSTTGVPLRSDALATLWLRLQRAPLASRWYTNLGTSCPLRWDYSRLAIGRSACATSRRSTRRCAKTFRSSSTSDTSSSHSAPRSSNT